MFNLFKRDPAQEKLKIPIELFSVTLAGASNTCNILNLAIFAYIIRCVRLAHIDAIPDKMRRTSTLTQFNDTLMQAALEMEQNVEKLMPKN